MPISKNWSTATRSHIESNVPNEPGVYELKNFGECVYIGYSTNLQRRLCDHLSKEPTAYRFVACRSKHAAKRLEDEHLDRFGTTADELPAWNANDTRTKQKGFLARLLG